MGNFKKNLKLYIIFSIFYETSGALYNPFVNKFVTRLGGTAFDITMLNVIKGGVMAIATLPLVYYVNKKNNRKASILKLLTLMSLALIAIAFVSMIDAPYVHHLFLLATAVFFIPISAFSSTFQDFTANKFPIRRADVIARKNMFTIIFMTIATFLMGMVFNKLSNSVDSLKIYQGAYFLSALFILVSVFIFNKFKCNEKQEVTTVRIMDSLSYVLKHKEYKRFLISSTLFYFGWTMGWPLFSIYTIDNLKASEMWLSLISVTSTVSVFFGHMLWPKVINKIGESRVSFIATFGMSITPLLYAVSSNLKMLVGVSFITGIFTSATMTVLLADLLSVSPEENRFLYTAYYYIFSNVMLFVSPLIGQEIMTLSNIFVALIVTAIFRFIGSYAFYLRR